MHFVYFAAVVCSASVALAEEFANIITQSSPPSTNEVNVLIAGTLSRFEHYADPRTDSQPPGQPFPSSKRYQTTTHNAVVDMPPPAPPPGTGSADTPTKARGNGAFYVSPVKVGNQILQIQLDTASSNFWVYNKTSSLGRGYAWEDSKTFTLMPNYTSKLRYGDGSIVQSDIVGTETVSIGGLTVPNQVIEIASENSTVNWGGFEADVDGVMGLGFIKNNAVSPQKQQTWIENIIPKLATKAFSVILDPGRYGEFEFGRIGREKYNGEIFYADVNSSTGYWAVTSKIVKMGNLTVDLPTDDAVVDTGSSLILIPDAAADTLYKSIGGFFSVAEQGHIYPCSATLTDMQFALGSNGLFSTLPAKAFEFGKSWSTPGHCYGTVQGNRGFQFSIHGDALISQYVSFGDLGMTKDEFGHPKVRYGIAQKSGNYTGPTNDYKRR